MSFDEKDGPAEFNPSAAAAVIADLVPNAGMTIQRRDRFSALGLPDPQTINNAEFAEIQRLNLEAVKRWAATKAALRLEFGISFKMGSQGSHERLADAQVAPYFERASRERAKRALDEAIAAASSVPAENLSAAERQARTDMLARTARMRQALDGRRKRAW